LPSLPDRKTAPFIEPPTFLSGGGGLVSTTSDFLRLGLMLLGGGQWNGVRLLSRKTVELMTADHLPAGHPPIQPFGFGFGLGVSVVRRLGELRKLGSIDPIKTSNSLAMSDISGKAEGLEKHGPLKAVMNRRCVGRQEQL
jgi:CubicO group peptidase (beta-lactamase class C family)